MRMASIFFVSVGLISLNCGFPQYASAQWRDIDPSISGKCESAAVNDAGTTIIDCEVSNVAIPYVVFAGQSAVPLGGIIPNEACYAEGINNAASGKETVFGKCMDNNNVWQAVVWSMTSPSKPTQLLPLNVLFGILINGVSAQASDIDIVGDVIGTSTDNLGEMLPVVWRQGSATPTPLVAPLLSNMTNCVPASINDSSSHSVIGNCPAGPGLTNAVLWQTLASNYVVLPVPSEATNCTAKRINVASQTIGDCYFGADVTRAVEWASGGTGPVALLTVNGIAVKRSFTARVNDSGVVAVAYMGNGSLTSQVLPAIWNPASGGTDAGAIQLPGQAIHGIVGEIGNNGKAIGYYETSGGSRHPFHVEPNNFGAVDDGSPEGGPNASAEELSPSGIWEAGFAENPQQVLQAIVQPTP